MTAPPRVLYAASEALPFSKTGGLADVAQALPAAIARGGLEVRLVTPAYRGAREKLKDPRLLGTLPIRGQPFQIWEGSTDTGTLRIWLVDFAPLYGRAGSPYADADGREHADNAWRFGCFSEAVAALAQGAVTDWLPDVLHLNDWQTGLAPVWLQDLGQRPRIVFTIHNLAYQGVFPRADFDALGVPAGLWSHEALEYWGNGSFLKGGIVFADRLTTVSPTYAREIQTAEHGHGLDGLLRHRAADLAGILNGIDDDAWNPATDPYLVENYGTDTLHAGKRANKRALQTELLLDDSGHALVGMVSRLAHQKGIDLVVAAAREILRLPLQLAVLGSGDPQLEEALRTLAREHPSRVAVRIGYDEALAHRIEAAADLFLMPSRYEPCGLNQMYSQRYGTIPIVRRTGGLADSVVDATPENLKAGTATGISFDGAEPEAVVAGLRRALKLRPHWAALRRAGMQRDFSWRHTAEVYRSLYADIGSQRTD